MKGLPGKVNDQVPSAFRGMLCVAPLNSIRSEEPGVAFPIKDGVLF